MLVSRWSADVVVLTDGPGYPTPNAWQRRYRQKIGIREEPVARFLSSGRQDLRRIKFMDASQHQRSPLVADIDACLTSKAAVGSIRPCKPPSPARTLPTTLSQVPSRRCWPLPTATGPLS